MGMNENMFKHTPLLQLQRDLYHIPRGQERFQTYITTMTEPETGELALPLSAMNPMGKDHIPALLDTYLAFDADEIAQKIVGRVSVRSLFEEESFSTALVLADDAHGQWTNRIATDFDHRYHCRPMFRRGWLVALLWTSETPSVTTVEKTLLEAIYRGVHIHQNGYPTTLKQLIEQEGFAQANAGAENELTPEELDYTHEVLKPLMQTDEEPTLIAALFGDPAAKELGHQPLGLSSNAGLQLGLHLQSSI